jgi:ERF superfamily
MQTRLDYKRDFLCVLSEFEIADGKPGRTLLKEWYPVHAAEAAEAQAMVGRPVTATDSVEGLYVDEEGNVYQLADRGATKPIEVEHLPGTDKTELEVQLEASLKGGQPNGKNSRAKRLLKKNRSSNREQQASQNGTAKPAVRPAHASSAEPSATTLDVAAPGNPGRLNLRQKLAEVRRRIGYVQKRGHNERFGYSYVTAADIAGAVGDLLSQLGVVVIPSLESISYEPVRTSNGQIERVAHVVMTYTFTDVDSGEAVTVKVPGEGLDAGDKAPYKAMTGALKYALLQSFLLATGDDPEDERTTPSGGPVPRERSITPEEACNLRQLIEDTETELERVLAYYKVGSLEEMTESAYRRALEVLNRKLAKRGHQGEAVHAQD